MSGGIISWQMVEKDVARRMNNLRTAYCSLKSLDNQHTLLTLLRLKDDDTQQSHYPTICPVNFSYQFTPEFFKVYREHQPAKTANILMNFAEALEKYSADMEEEVSRIRKSRDVV